MIKVIKQIFARIISPVRDFLTKVMVTIHSGVKVVKSWIKALRFPVWYFILLHVSAFIAVTEITETWILWATFMLGFGVWAFKQTNK